MVKNIVTFLLHTMWKTPQEQIAEPKKANSAGQLPFYKSEREVNH